MKKYWLFIALLFIGIETQSQILISLLLGDKLNTGNIEFGLEGGFNWAWISGMETNKALSNLNLGFYFDIKIKDQWYLDTGLLVKSTLGVDNLTDKDLAFLGVDTYEDDGNYSQRMNYFLVPALVKYKFKNNVYVEAGPQFGLMYKGWVEYIATIEDKTTRVKDYNTDMINRLDAGLTAGVGYRLLKGLGWTLGAEYYYGLVNIYKDASGNKNSSLFFKVNIPIGVSEAVKNEVKAQKELIKEKKAAKKAKKELKKSKKQ